MKLATVLIPAAFAASVVAEPVPGWIPSQVTISEDHKVPGDNPLYFCADPKDYIVEIDKVDLSPNPPEAGKKLKITAKGTVSETIEEGSKIHLQVKYGLITLINQEADLCETIGKADLECPLDKGDMELTKEVDLPKEIPPGTYTVLADAYTKDGDKITCLNAKVAFHR
ncbi:ML domain-containing protein [Lophiotrema nucula]|uniref:Phosphatidylglycerol/phosphatidylinositol transfer protein n=1 Tax=Lophiotrema nucula TaxID=690887 RepID=A0A6A5YVK2_9PLEO|nr:ML domain-containing protein [Lophiotrema nucula]